MQENSLRYGKRESLDGLMTRVWTYFVALVMKKAKHFSGQISCLGGFHSFSPHLTVFEGNEALNRA